MTKRIKTVLGGTYKGQALRRNLYRNTYDVDRDMKNILKLAYGNKIPESQKLVGSPSNMRQNGVILRNYGFKPMAGENFAKGERTEFFEGPRIVKRRAPTAPR